MHNLSASFVLGYHGCDRQTGERLLQNEPFKPSENDFDWLGAGIYFWEANPDRALVWAREKTQKQPRSEPFVVGAVIDPGFCLDLVSASGLQAIEDAYADFHAVITASGGKIPRNSLGEDHLLRKLDCAVINSLHSARRVAGQQSFDSVRGVFTEGDPIYKNSGFRRKTHIQICVRNPENILGVFRVPPRHFSQT